MVRIINGEVVPDNDPRANNGPPTANPGHPAPQPRTGDGQPSIWDQLNEQMTVFGYTTVRLGVIMFSLT